MFLFLFLFEDSFNLTMYKKVLEEDTHESNPPIYMIKVSKTTETRISSEDMKVDFENSPHNRSRSTLTIIDGLLRQKFYSEFVVH